MVDQKVYHVNTNGFGYGDSLDFDQDGIPDYQDADPYYDTDGDGVPDVNDKCPTEYGLEDNMGCPEITMEIVSSPMLMIEFEFILVSSFEDMVEKNPHILKLEKDSQNIMIILKMNFHQLDITWTW